MATGFLAIDLSPSRLAAGVVDDEGNVVVRDRVTTPARNVWPVLTQLVKRVLAANPSQIEPTSVGVTCPGPIDQLTGAMKPVGLPTWHDFPLRREIADITELAVAIDTAGRGLALAEMWCGDTRLIPDGRRNFATLVLGDDVDGGLVVRGRLASGLTGNLGQFGHLIVEPEGVVCGCGATGCLTAYAGARGIEASTNRELRRTPVAIVERTGIMTARACATIAAVLDVSDIVIGGVVPSVLGVPFFDALSKELDQRSGLEHLQGLRVRGIGDGRLGPLVAAAAVARHADAERAADHTPTESGADAEPETRPETRPETAPAAARAADPTSTGPDASDIPAGNPDD